MGRNRSLVFCVILCFLRSDCIGHREGNGNGIFYVFGYRHAHERVVGGGDVLDRYGVFFRIVDYLPMYLTGIIFLLLMLMAGDGEKYKGMVIKASAASGILITLSLIINNAFELFLFAAGYVLLFPLIALGAGKEKRAFVPASAVFFVCMIWRLYSAMALY